MSRIPHPWGVGTISRMSRIPHPGGLDRACRYRKRRIVETRGRCDSYTIRSVVRANTYRDDSAGRIGCAYRCHRQFRDNIHLRDATATTAATAVIHRYFCISAIHYRNPTVDERRRANPRIRRDEHSFGDIRCLATLPRDSVITHHDGRGIIVDDVEDCGRGRRGRGRRRSVGPAILARRYPPLSAPMNVIAATPE